MLEGAITGVLSSVIASALFLFILLRFRPKLLISPYISMSHEGDGSNVYMIKVINRTPRKVINLKAQLLLQEHRNVPGGFVYDQTIIPLAWDSEFLLERYRRNDREARYAFRLACEYDLDRLWNDQGGDCLLFRVSAQDSITGFTSVFSTRYHTKRDAIKRGSHKFGDSLDVC
jgi:hypothetical protein